MTEHELQALASDIEVFSVLIGMENSNGLYTLDAIAYEGKLWLVPEWLEAPTQRVRRPARMIRFDHLPHQPAPKDFPHRFVLNEPLPASVFDGTSAEGFEVLSEAHTMPWCRIPDRSLS